MALSRIKEKFLNNKVGFAGSAKPLGSREDIDALAIIALESQDKTLIELFDFLPDLAALKKAKTDAELRRNSPIKN